MRRVVVTGLGMVSPLWSGVSGTWQRLVNGESGISRVENFDVSAIACKVAAQLPKGDAAGAFRPDEWMSAKDQRKTDDFIIFAVAAASEAVDDAEWTPEDESSLARTGVVIGSGIGGLTTIADTAIVLHERGPRRVSPHFMPAALINLAAGHVSIRYGFRGPNLSVVTACSTGTHAIGEAARIIQRDDADVMVAGGTEAPICPLGLAGFAAARRSRLRSGDRPQPGWWRGWTSGAHPISTIGRCSRSEDPGDPARD